MVHTASAQNTDSLDLQSRHLADLSRPPVAARCVAYTRCTRDVLTKPLANDSPFELGSVLPKATVPDSPVEGPTLAFAPLPSRWVFSFFAQEGTFSRTEWVKTPVGRQRLVSSSVWLPMCTPRTARVSTLRSGPHRSRPGGGARTATLGQDAI